MDRFKAWLFGITAYLVVSFVSWTMRWRLVDAAYLNDLLANHKRVIVVFWHGRIFPAVYYGRNRDCVVLTSHNRDGERIARAIKRFGYRPARGSSSRGGVKALAEMAHEIHKGRDTAFTIDGPRGPRYIAKPGPVILARKTGAAILCLHFSMKNKIQLKSWDAFQIPLPFTRAVVLHAPPIWVPADATPDQMVALHQQMQDLLDGLRIKGDSWWD